MNYDELPAGREMDELVAQFVMGYAPVIDVSELKRLDWYTEGDELLTWWRDSDGDWSDVVPKYSTDIEEAWEVVEHFSGEYWAKLTTPFGKDSKYNAGFTQHEFTGWNGRPDYRAQGDTMPEAICRAALKLKQYAPELPPEEKY